MMESEREESECFSFLLILLMTPLLSDPVKTRLLESQTEVEEQTNDNASSHAL